MSIYFFKKLLATFEKVSWQPACVFSSIIYTFSDICLFLFHWNILKFSENSKTFFVYSTGGLVDNHNYLSIHNYQINEFSENSPCTHFPPTFQKLFQNSSVRVPLRLQKFFKSKFYESFSKSRVYVYSYPQKTFLKVSFLKESLSKNVYVYRGEQMFDFSNKISEGLFII